MLREHGNKQTEKPEQRYLRQPKYFQSKAATRDKKGPSDPTSGYLPEETQSATLKGPVNPYVNCSIIYSSQGNLAVRQWMNG